MRVIPKIDQKLTSNFRKISIEHASLYLCNDCLHITGQWSSRWSSNKAVWVWISMALQTLEAYFSTSGQRMTAASWNKLDHLCVTQTMQRYTVVLTYCLFLLCWCRELDSNQLSHVCGEFGWPITLHFFRKLYLEFENSTNLLLWSIGIRIIIIGLARLPRGTTTPPQL